MYEVSNTNGAYHRCLASDICVDRSCLPSTFPSTEHSLASPLPLLRLQHLHYLASHISVRYHAEDCLLSHKHSREDSDLPSRIVHNRSPERYVPSGQHLLLPARIPTTTCITVMYRPSVPLSVSLWSCLPGRYTPLSHCLDARTSHVIASHQEVHYAYIRGCLLFY